MTGQLRSGWAAAQWLSSCAVVGLLRSGWAESVGFAVARCRAGHLAESVGFAVARYRSGYLAESDAVAAAVVATVPSGCVRDVNRCLTVLAGRRQ